MSGANYEWCRGCDTKAMYVGDVDVPEDVEVWHKACRERAVAKAAEAERERIYGLLGNDHFVIFTEDRWTIEHSVECRLGGRMHECRYHAAIGRIAAEFDPGMAGRWRIDDIDSEGLPVLERTGPVGGAP